MPVDLLLSSSPYRCFDLGAIHLTQPVPVDESERKVFFHKCVIQCEGQLGKNVYVEL